MPDAKVTRKELVVKLNEDLAREYQATIAYVVYSQVLKGAQYMSIATELEKHAHEELQHALTIAKQIDYLGGMPTATSLPVKLSDKAEEMLRAFHDLVTDEAADAPQTLGDLRMMQGVRKFPQRVKCAMLAWRAVEQALRQSEGEATVSTETDS